MFVLDLKIWKLSKLNIKSIFEIMVGKKVNRIPIINAQCLTVLWGWRLKGQMYM